MIRFIYYDTEAWRGEGATLSLLGEKETHLEQK